LLQESVPIMTVGPESDHAVRVELDLEPAARLTPNYRWKRLRRQSRLELDRHSGYQPAAGGVGLACGGHLRLYRVWLHRPVNCAPNSTGGEQTNAPFCQFPYLANIFQMGNVYRSNYDGLQSVECAQLSRPELVAATRIRTLSMMWAQLGFRLRLGAAPERSQSRS